MPYNDIYSKSQGPEKSYMVILSSRPEDTITRDNVREIYSNANINKSCFNHRRAVAKILECYIIIVGEVHVEKIPGAPDTM